MELPILLNKPHNQFPHLTLHNLQKEEVKFGGGVKRTNNEEDERSRRYRQDNQPMIAGLSNISHFRGLARNRVGGNGVGDGRHLSNRKEDSEEYSRWQHRLSMRRQVNRNLANPENFREEAAIDMQNSLVNMKNKRLRESLLKSNDPFNQLSNVVKRTKSKRKEWLNRNVASDGRAQKKDKLYKTAAVEGKEKLKQQRGEQFSVGFDKNDMPQVSSSYRHFLGKFDVEEYLSSQRMLMGQGDPMSAFQFNQVASDATAPDRKLMDYRNPK